jgi:hypothetical protein
MSENVNLPKHLMPLKLYNIIIIKLRKNLKCHKIDANLTFNFIIL